MASVRETNSLILRRLECLEKSSNEIKTRVKNNSEKLDRIHSQSYLPAIPRPKQGVGISRTSSIAAFLREEIKTLNSARKDGEPRYLEFPDEVSDKQVNADALNCFEIILMFHLDFHYGRISWEKVTKKMPRVAATIYREARMTPELVVFAQTAAVWAIDLLLTAKMKSRMRSNHQEPNGQEQQTVIPDVSIPDQQAVMAVPEIAPNSITQLVVNGTGATQNLELNQTPNQNNNVQEKHDSFVTGGLLARSAEPTRREERTAHPECGGGAENRDDDECRYGDENERNEERIASRSRGHGKRGMSGSRGSRGGRATKRVSLGGMQRNVQGRQ